LQPLREAPEGNVARLSSARDTEDNNTVALKDSGVIAED
jgi:hypothetical protein